jgi:hypothetical protein
MACVSVPLALGLAWLLGFPALVAVRWAAGRRRDDAWLLDIGADELRVRPRGSLTRARPEDWDVLASVARDLGVDTIVVDLPDADETAQWALRRASERIGSVARLTLAA